MGHGVGGTPIDLDIYDHAFGTFICIDPIQSDETASQQTHANAHDLPGTQMAMGRGGRAQKCFKSFQL